MRRFKIYLLGLTAISFMACKPQDSGLNGTTTSGSTTPGAGAPGVSDTSPLALSIITKYDNDAAPEIAQTFVETGTPICATSDSTPSITCTLNIEEGRLYFSKIKFSFAWMLGKCKLLNFQPYYYQASPLTNASFLPPWANGSPIDCTANPTPAGCWGGAAPELVPGFPQYRSIIYIPNESLGNVPQATDLTLSSGYKSLAGSNRKSANDLAASKIGNTYTSAQLGGLGDTYVANTFTDYIFTCRDDWYDPVSYKITLKINDIDSATGHTVIDNMLTWKEAP